MESLSAYSEQCLRDLPHMNLVKAEKYYRYIVVCTTVLFIVQKSVANGHS